MPKVFAINISFRTWHSVEYYSHGKVNNLEINLDFYELLNKILWTLKNGYKAGYKSRFQIKLLTNSDKFRRKE